MMTKKVINSMMSRTKKSAIINMSSIAGVRPLLYLAPYSATKAYNDFFARALSLEFSEKYKKEIKNAPKLPLQEEQALPNPVVNHDHAVENNPKKGKAKT